MAPRNLPQSLYAICSVYPRAIVLGSLLLLIVGLSGLTPFRSPDQVLSESSWGAGTPTGTWITAFATFRPWWHTIVPDPVVVTPNGGLQPIVVIPRGEIRQKTQSLVLPVRSIGYDAILGIVTAVRSFGADGVVYDFGLFVRVQQIILVLAWAIAPIGIFAFASLRELSWRLTLYVPVFLVTLLAKPTKDIFLAQGIIDSSLASPLALLAIPALCGGTWVSRKSMEWWHVTVGLAIGLFLGFSSLVRGELLLVFMTAFILIGLVLVQSGIRSVLKMACIMIVMLSVPIAYGIVNQAVLGRFIPLRMQSGQNLYEPIGQYQNPYGIEYSDVWAEQHLRDRGIEYVSFEADDYFAAEYFRLLRSDPLLFVGNFLKRLASIKLSLSIINVWTLPLALFGLGYVLRANPEWLSICVPWILLCSFVIVCAWFNDAPRIIAPVHFLTNTSIAIGLTVLLQRWLSRRYGLVASVNTAAVVKN